MSIIKWKSNEEMPVVSNLFDSFFGKHFADFIRNDFEGTLPATNIYENNLGFRIEVAAPGLDKQDFKINVNNQQLTISAKKEFKEENKEEKLTRKEFGYTSFERSFSLPQSVEAEKIDAKYEKGILTINVPKKEEHLQKSSREINIS